MLEVQDPGTLAASLEIELERYRRAGTIVRMPAAMAEQARTLGKIAGMLREAAARGQAVDLGDEVVRLIEQFRLTLATVGGSPAEA